ncbi:MAG: metal-dependent hydrolase [Anaerolineales bacterium]
MTIEFTWYGHATIGLQIDGIQLLVDPFFSGNPVASTTAADVSADYILITHGHGDHVGDAVSIASRTGAPIITNYEIAVWLDKQGVANTHAQHIGGGHRHPFGYLKFTPALHGSALPDGSNGGNPCGFLLHAGDKRVYLAGDTGLFGDMALIGAAGLDLAALPIGDNYTMGPDDALQAVEFLAPAVAVPIHYNTFDLIAQDAAVWKARVEAGTNTAVQVLKPGESITV